VVASALKSAFDETSANAVAEALKPLGYETHEVPNALGRVFGQEPKTVVTILKDAKYPEKEVAGVAERFGLNVGDFFKGLSHELRF
jgi:hypothetical protein